MIRKRDCSERIYKNAGNLSLLALVPDNSFVLDCGCGAGDNARILRSRGCRITGITISPTELDTASAYCEEVYLWDLECGIPETIRNKYDVVLMSHVLEHLFHPGRVLQDTKKVLKSGGILVVALPNVLMYRIRLDFLLGRFEYTDGGIMDETHVRFYTFATGAKLLEANGYKLVKEQSEGAFPLWKARNILPVGLVKALNHFVVKHWPGIFGWQSLYLARVAG